MNNLVVPEHVMRLKDQYGVLLDAANGYVTASGWTALAADAGTSVALTDGTPPYVLLTTGATDNNEAAIRSQVEAYTFLASKPIKFGAIVRFAEANTDDANVFIGLSDAIGANQMVDDGAGPKTTMSGAYFHKADGATRWSVGRSVGTTQSTVDLTAVNSYDRLAKTAGSTSYQILEIAIDPAEATNFTVSWFIDGVLVYQQVDVALASATDMHAGVYVKAGGANSETVRVAACWAYAKR